MVINPPVNFRSPVFFTAICLICGASLFFLNIPWFTSTKISVPVSGEGCAVLIVDESENDKYIREKISQNGLGDFVSESSQYVPIDDFGTFKFIPLDSYSVEMEAFDPRDSGYAVKLRSFFVHDGKRFLFSPIGTGSRYSRESTEKKLGAILGNIPFTLVVLRHESPILLNFILLAVGCLSALFLSRSRWLFIFQFPLLLSISYYGFYAMILAAIITGIWELLREPLGELFATIRYNRTPGYAGSKFNGMDELFKPFRINFILVVVFLLFLVLFSVTGVLSPVFLASVCVSFSFLYLLSFYAEAERIRKMHHMPFIPVLLFSNRTKTFSLFPLLLPFGLLSLVSLFFAQGISEMSPMDPGYFISSEEYEDHIAFQRSFSFRSMNDDPDIYGYEALKQDDYFRYYLGEDGLIAGTAAYIGSEEESPPFPLEKLMDFLIKYNEFAVNYTAKMRVQLNTPMAARFKEWISVVIIFAICLLDFLRPAIASKKKPPLIWDKRIAA